MNKWRKFGKKQLGTGRLGKAGKYRLRLLPDLTRAAPAARGGAGEGKDKASSKADDEAGSKAGNKAEQQAPGGLTKHVAKVESEPAEGAAGAGGGPARVDLPAACARQAWTSVSEAVMPATGPLSRGYRSAGVGVHPRGRDHVKRQPKLSKKLLETGLTRLEAGFGRGGGNDDRSYKKGLFEKRLTQLVLCEQGEEEEEEEEGEEE